MHKLIVITLIFSGFSFSLNSQVEGILLGSWSDDSLVSSAAHDNTYNEVWGLDVNGHEIAVIGSTEGTHFIDVTDPGNPTEIQFVKGGAVGRSIIHRDFHDLNGFLYAVADEGFSSTLQIIDISMLPDSVSVVYDSKEFIRRSHNIFIDSSASRMYACFTNGDSVSFSGLRIFDISDPYAPLVLAAHNSVDGFPISGLHDAYVDNNIAYLNSGTSGFGIADFSDAENPILLGSLLPHEYPESGYNHSGWLSEDKKTYFLADETFGTRMKILDVSQLPEINVIGFLSSDSGESAEIPHNQIVHGNYLYTSYYFDGLQVYDVSDVNNVQRVLHYDTSTIPHTNGIYRGAWGVYPFLPSGNILVSDMQNGLFVVQSVNETMLSDTDELDLAGESFSVYPNPFSDQIVLEIPDTFDKEAIDLSIFSNDGKKVIQRSYNSPTQIELTPGLRAGIYQIQLSNRYRSITQRIIKL